MFGAAEMQPTLSNRQSRGAVGTIVLALLFAVAAPDPASAADQQQTCSTNWGNSVASDYCPNATISWHETADFRTVCTVNVTCTVDVDVGEEEQRFSSTFSYETTVPQGLTLCFRSERGTDGDLAWSMSMHGYCGSATDVETAVEDGLAAR
ncbi:MAG: hypothetical protein F4X98_09805 [Gammaproteobacteria bacterium]|nr:hypothetical protein [Gammaproteobacteria bacterium]